MRDFYHALLAHLAVLGLNLKIRTRPNEIVDGIPFDQDEQHASYDAEYVNRFWRALVQADRVLQQFRAGYVGKCSPVHFFLGSFDLAVTRFSRRPAPEHPGGELLPYPLFYSYAYPEPPGFSTASVGPAGARYDAALREFVLPYDAVRLAASPDAALLEFLQSSYRAAATLGGWDRVALERTAQLRGAAAVTPASPADCRLARKRRCPVNRDGLEGSRLHPRSHRCEHLQHPS